MPIEPAEAEAQRIDGLSEKLEQHLDNTDNAGAAESIQQITRMIASLIDRAAEGAKQTLSRLVIVLLIAAAVTALTAYYFVNNAGFHPAWSALPITAALVPGSLLLIGIRMLMAVISLPSNIGEVGDLLASIARDHLHELHLLEKKKLRGRLKWKAFVLVAKLLWKCRKMTKEKQDEIGTGILLFGLVANPIFWMVLLGAIVVLLTECALMLGAVAVHMIFF
ncbi:MAG: hypothetical protein KTR15_12325 [Phycisphaeraceae bacterium]|nr:hypothetical protein [Phycisphaeraceae bacterium]